MLEKMECKTLLAGAASSATVGGTLSSFSSGLFYVEEGFTQVCVVVALFEGKVESGGSVSEGIVGGLG